MVQLGLSWWQAWICVWLGYGVVAPFICLNARPGAIFHVTFPVVARTSFGLYGSLWCTFNRGAMAWCVMISKIMIWNYIYLIMNSIPQHLVWCAGQYRWRLHEGHAPSNLAKCKWYTCVTCLRITCIDTQTTPANNLPESSGTTTRDFMCFFLFWLISLPAIWFPIHKMLAPFPCGNT